MGTAPARTFAGGGAKIVKIPADQTDFDIVVVGGNNATALTKFWQNDHIEEKIALVTDRSKFVCPELYYLTSYGAVKDLKLETGSVGAQVNASSRVNQSTRVTQFKPDENKVVLEDGKEYTYRALVLANGLDSKSEHIEGLAELEAEGERTNVFSHIVDTKDRMDRNYWHGWHHYNGDLVVYNPAYPFKDEGFSFYTFYYENLLRQEKVFGRASEDARIQFYTPNKSIFEYEYANSVTLEECEKRHIDVHFGQELVKVQRNALGEKVATFKNVDTGATTEKIINGLVAHPTNKTQPELQGTPLVNSKGLVDVNPYTLQHSRYENVFAFGSCADLPTTRSQYATMAQSPIIKRNVLQYLRGNELDGIYDGYSFIALFLGH